MNLGNWRRDLRETASRFEVGKNSREDETEER